MQTPLKQTNEAFRPTRSLQSRHLFIRTTPTNHGTRPTLHRYHHPHRRRINHRLGLQTLTPVPTTEHRDDRVLDDVGYAEFGCYGSDIQTPALNSLAANGLRYANFHATPLCSPTRTCLLTGRNHHSVGMGRVAEMVNGFPNTRGFASREAANLAEMLRPHGYPTLAAGKWHLGSVHENSPAGPYDHWPLQRGFDRFHGFLAGETNQWNPELITGNERVEPPSREGYHLSEDIVDQSCKWLRSWCPPTRTGPQTGSDALPFCELRPDINNIDRFVVANRPRKVNSQRRAAFLAVPRAPDRRPQVLWMPKR